MLCPIYLTLLDLILLKENTRGGGRLLSPVGIRLHKTNAACGKSSSNFTVRTIGAVPRKLGDWTCQPFNAEERIRPLISMKIDDIDPSLGIDVLQLEVKSIESIASQLHKDCLGVAKSVRTKSGESRLEDPINRIGLRKQPASASG